MQATIGREHGIERELLLGPMASVRGDEVEIAGPSPREQAGDFLHVLREVVAQFGEHLGIARGAVGRDLLEHRVVDALDRGGGALFQPGGNSSADAGGPQGTNRGIELA
jgi:hypothetical protein